jgi:CTP synthase (UTP-ammonia lyase)
MKKVKLAKRNNIPYLSIDLGYDVSRTEYNIIKAMADYHKLTYDEMKNVFLSIKNKMQTFETYFHKAHEKFMRNNNQEAFLKNVKWINENYELNENENIIVNTLIFESMISSDYKWKINF